MGISKKIIPNSLLHLLSLRPCWVVVLAVVWLGIMGPLALDAFAQPSRAMLQDFLYQHQLELNAPTEAPLRLVAPVENPYLDYPLALQLPREALEVRLVFKTYSQGAPLPQLDGYRLALHLGDNEKGLFTVRELTLFELDSVYHADWGSVYLFQPKVGFSPQQYCKMVTLFRENKGMVFVFYLFDRPSALIDQRLNLVRFQSRS